MPLASVWTQFFPPKPHYKETDVPDLQGKVYIVTGSNTGIGKEVVRVLYARNAKVYILARNESRAQEAIDDIKAGAPSSSGSLIFLPLDLNDLSHVKSAAEAFLAREQRLHSLFNNAGIQASDPLERTVQGHEANLGINCVGTFLLTRLLTPVLSATAQAAPPGAVRVVWLSSLGAELDGEKDIGLSTSNLDYHVTTPAIKRYSLSKAGVWALAVEYAKRHGTGKEGILSVPVNPGNVRSELQRHQSSIFKFLTGFFLYPTINGAYTQLFAAFSPTLVTADCSENWVGPFGRLLPIRPDLPKATKPVSEGGNDGTAKFWEWNEQQVREYL